MSSHGRLRLDAWTAGIGATSVGTLAYVLWFLSTDVTAPSLPGVPMDMHDAAMVVNIVSIVLCVLFLYRRTDMSGQKRSVWAVALVMASLIACPIFWFLHVLRRPARSEFSPG